MNECDVVSFFQLVSVLLWELMTWSCMERILVFCNSAMAITGLLPPEARTYNTFDDLMNLQKVPTQSVST